MPPTPAAPTPAVDTTVGTDLPYAEVFIDEETGGLRPGDDAWEIAAVRRLRDGRQTLHVWQVLDYDPSGADPKALDLGGFYQRHPLHVILDPADPLRIEPTDQERLTHPAFAITGPDPDVTVAHNVCTEYRIAYELERLTRGAVVWACNPVYDVPRAERMHNRNRRAWTAHYRPLCATTYAAATALALGRDVGPMPWNNSRVGAALGVDRDGYGTAHSGLADCLYAQALVDTARSLALAGIR